MNFVVLCSSNGTTFQAVLDRIADKSLTAKCLELITDRKDRGCITKAKKAGVPFRVVEKNKGESREDYDQRLHEEILSFSCHAEVHRSHPSRLALLAPQDDTSGNGASKHHQKMCNTSSDDIVVVCIGWMHIFSPWFIQQFPNRILNVHPALLPKYGGKGMYGIKVHEEVLKNHEKKSGMTIHIVTEEVDNGPILLQKHCPVLSTDTPETLQKRVQELEKEWYPKVLQTLNFPSP